MGDWLGLAGRPALVVGAGGLGGASAVSLAVQGARRRRGRPGRGRASSPSRGPRRTRGPRSSRSGADVSHAGREPRRWSPRPQPLVGTPQVFLHAVGRNDRRPVLELDDDDWQSILTLNLSTAWWLGQEVGRRMVAAGVRPDGLRVVGVRAARARATTRRTRRPRAASTS